MIEDYLTASNNYYAKHPFAMLSLSVIGYILVRTSNTIVPMRAYAVMRTFDNPCLVHFFMSDFFTAMSRLVNAGVHIGMPSVV